MTTPRSKPSLGWARREARLPWQYGHWITEAGSAYPLRDAATNEHAAAIALTSNLLRRLTETRP